MKKLVDEKQVEAFTKDLSICVHLSPVGEYATPFEVKAMKPVFSSELSKTLTTEITSLLGNP